MKKIIKYKIVAIILLTFSVKNSIYGQSTPKGTSLGANIVTLSPEWTAAEINSINASRALAYPNIIKLENPTVTYNCHNYAWVKSAGGSTFWLNPPGNAAFWNDNSYYQTSSTNLPNLRVSYQGDHTAVTTSTPGICKSKWGTTGVYQHATLDVPAVYLPNNPKTYYTCNYAPLLTTTTLDNSSNSSINNGGTTAVLTNFGSHNMNFNVLFSGNLYYPSFTFNALDPGVNITGQSSSLVNFNFSSTPARYNVNMTNSCGSSTSTIILYKNGARMSVYPNPATEEATVELLKIENSTELIPAMDDKSTDVKINELKLFDSNNNLKRSYLLINDDSNKGSIKFDKDLKGVYYLKAFFSDGTTQVKRIQIGKL